MFLLNWNKQKTHPNSLKESIFGNFSEKFGLFRFVSVCSKHRNKPKFFVFGFTKQTETNAKQILFWFVSVGTEIYFCLLRGHPTHAAFTPSSFGRRETLTHHNLARCHKLGQLPNWRHQFQVGQPVWYNNIYTGAIVGAKTWLVRVGNYFYLLLKVFDLNFSWSRRDGGGRAWASFTVNILWACLSYASEEHSFWLLSSFL